ncbi:MAG TPA: PadR family transcriptional regulator [Candidatus Saccharimonadia bacterium]|jgi:DNA-binding PadR family transcriptional regulator
MKRAPNYDDVMPLTEREVRILVALCGAKTMTGYSIGRQVEEDAGKNIAMGNGTLRPALDRLNRYGVIENVGVDKTGPGLPARIWRVTSLGRMILEWELSSYRRLVRLGEGRL